VATAASQIGTDDYPQLTLAERDRRYALTRNLLEREGLDALLVYGEREGVTSPRFSPDTYFTNDRPGAVVVFPKEGEVLALALWDGYVGNHIEDVARGSQTWLAPGNIATGAGGAAIARALQGAGLARGRIGVLGLEPGFMYHADGAFSYGTWTTVREGVPDATFVPVWQQFLDVVLSKSDEELRVLQRSAEIGERMCEAALAATRPGVTEADIYAAAMHACYANGGASSWMILVSGPENVAWGPPPWTYRPEPPRVIESGDVVQLELFVSYGAMESQHQLTVAVDEVHPDVERCADASRAAYDAAVEVMRPGVRFADVVRAMDAPIEAVGGWTLTPHIHSLNPMFLCSPCGLDARAVPEVGRYRSVEWYASVGDDATLQAGATFSLQPNCAIGKRRVNIGGTIALTDQGVVEYNSLANWMRRAG
jgi:Xaa-Pro aminopeptidase